MRGVPELLDVGGNALQRLLAVGHAGEELGRSGWPCAPGCRNAVARSWWVAQRHALGGNCKGKISCPRVKPASVSPAARAVSTARPVTPEMAASRPHAGGGRLVHHLVAGTAGDDDEALARRQPGALQRAHQLVQRVVAAHVLAQQGNLAVGAWHQAAAMGGTGWRAPSNWCDRKSAMALPMAAAAKAGPADSRLGGRTACSRLSVPHRPQPVRPVRLRRRSFKRAKHGRGNRHLHRPAVARRHQLAVRWTWDTSSTRPSDVQPCSRRRSLPGRPGVA